MRSPESPEFFATNIQRYDVSQTERLPHDLPTSKSDAYCVTTDDGQAWVRKGDLIDPWSTVSEIIAWRLATIMQIAIPQGALLSDDGDIIWMSKYMIGAQHWDPNHAIHLCDPAQIGLVMAFDLVICNGDRHHRNLLMADRDEGGVDLWAIDHDAAQLPDFRYWDSDRALRLPVAPSAGLHVLDNVPRGMFDEVCREAAARISGTPEFLITQALEASFADAGKPYDENLDRVLRERLENLCAMMDKCLQGVYR